MTEIAFGGLQVSGSDIAWPVVKFDRLAIDGRGNLLFASVLADSGIVKGIRAVLNSPKKVTANASGVYVKRASEESWRQRIPNNIGVDNGQYKTLIHRLEYGMAHAFFMSAGKGFMPALTDEHLWSLLNTTEYTTPLLPEWITYIRKTLISKGLLEEAACYRCECAMLLACTADLDLIVTEGLSEGFISIPN